MEHETFPVEGFEFMDAPATDEQKAKIRELATASGIALSAGPWPDPFSRWDAACMIESLEAREPDGQVG